ncbi:MULTISPECIES: hypothetical protein [unclassified Stenotrophomonas]|jgi:hypothetical protein|uniref:hypothetical protein n=1 Tax=unclassified Stenotrophomonas TaxID=196198 RepID=UPI001054C0E2|nr:hypothetical protein [Stenotrophomonas sp. LMG 10879]
MKNLFGFSLVVFLAGGLCSCSHGIIRPAAENYRVDVVDRAEERRFDVSLVSNDDRALCVSKESWPDATGGFSVARDDTFVLAGGDRLQARSGLMSAYCPGGCGEHRVEPHGALRGFISYEAFAGSKVLAGEGRKELHFSVSPYYCR